jgi:hypothetical protein
MAVQRLVTQGVKDASTMQRGLQSATSRTSGWRVGWELPCNDTVKQAVGT